MTFGLVTVYTTSRKKMAKKADSPKPKKNGKDTKRPRTPRQLQYEGANNEVKENVLEALKSSLGIISNACIKCKISRKTFYNWYNKDESFKERVDDIYETQKDFVESNLIKKIKDGDTSCIIFYAKTKMKDRGYAERVEITGKDGESIKEDVSVKTNFADVLKAMAKGQN